MKHVANCYKKYADFTGRATRREFWLFILFVNITNGFLLLCSLIATLLYAHIKPPIQPLIVLLIFTPSILFTLANMIPSYAVGARRLHDAGFSGWLQLLSPIPFLNLVLIIFFCLESVCGPNQYGADPFGRPPLPKY
jgi:uncharacterized membrane protein YhaH (DUF805 family)